MTSRERVRATLNHTEPDMLAIDFAGHRSSGISAVAYNRLKEKLGYHAQTTKVYDLMQQLAWPEPFVVDRFGGDVFQVLGLRPSYGIKADRWKTSTLPDGSSCLVPYDFNPVQNAKGDYDIIDPKTGICCARRPKDGLYYDSVRFYLSEVDSIEELDRLMVLPEVTDEDLAYLEAQAIEQYYNTDKALLLHVGGSIFEQGQQDFGYENFFYNLAGEPELIHHWAQKLVEANLTCLKRTLDRVGKYIDVVLFGGDDMGTQLDMQISLSMYREMIKPYQSALYQFVRKNYPNVKVGLHSCGAIYKLIPDLIEAGVQVLNPIQISAKGMDPVQLKKEFGKDIVFWGGGADMQQLVTATDSLPEIYNHCRKMIDIFAPGGGFVFTQVHNILADISPEKVMTIYQAALDARKG